MTIAPAILSEAMNLDAKGKSKIVAMLTDDLIAYYATEDELKLSNEELFKLIATN